MFLLPFLKPRQALKFILAFALATTWLHAAPYFGEVFTYQQPDGETIQIHLYGDEFFAYQETSDGYLVVRDPKNGFFCYAKVTPDGSDIISTGARVGQAKPAGLNPKQRLATNKAMQKSLGNRNLLGVDDKGRRNHGKKLFKGKNGEIINVKVAEALPQPSAGDQPAPEASAEPPPDSPPVAPAPPPAPTLNQRVGLVLLASFPDRPTDITKTVANIDDYCNAESYTTDGNATSVYGYFKMQSNGKLSYKNNVTAWFTAANPRSYYTDNTVGYGTRARDLIKEGLAVLKAKGFDFTQCDGNNDGRLDGINCFYAGARTNAWSEGIWPHQSSSSWTGLTGTGLSSTSYDYQITDMPASLPIGTFCHENGHMICDFPDLYSYYGCAANMGAFSLMASSGSTHPRHVDPYLKIHAGWADVVDITSASQQLCAVQQDRNFFYRYKNPAKATEYFIFEVRGTAGYEGVWNGAGATNPANGLVIYHALQGGSNPSSTIFTRANPPTTTLDYTTPYELMVVEATPSVLANGDPWYTDPTPASNDSFSSAGVSSITDSTTPVDLKFWAADGRTLASVANINTITAAGQTMTFIAGAGALPATPATNVTATQFQPNVDFGENAASQTFAVFNAGGGTLTYTVSDNVTWLACAPAITSTATTEADLITVSYTTNALAAGNHTATITIDGGAAGIKTIGVTLTVNPRPTLASTPVSLSVAGITGISGPNGTFNLSNTGGGTVSYAITKTQAWLTLDRTSGSVESEQDLVTATFNATSLAPGVYTDTITVTAAEATNSPLTIPVSYTVGSTDMILTSPNGGETWYINNTRAITWASSLGGTVKIELFKGGVLNTTIAASAPNNGSYNWTLPGTLTLASDYKIKITINPNGASDESFSNFSIAEDLLALALDTPSLSWTTSTAAWFRTTTVANTHDGVDAAESANITHGEATTMETTIVGPGTMTFWWKVSSESGYDFLRFYLNGAEQTGSLARISGTVAWVQKTVTIPAGSNVVKWGYDKDGSVDGGTDTAWVDQVVFTPDAQPEIAVEQPAATDLTDGTATINFGSVNTGSSTPLTFTIKNVGTADLTGLALAKTGTHSADYTLGTLSTTTLAAGTSTTFTVTFAPGGTGTRTAAIQIASDDANENPFDINLTGTGVGPGTLVVTGAGGLTSSGTYAGPFTPSSIDYTLSNPGNSSITWQATEAAAWVDLNAPGASIITNGFSGTLAAGASTTVTASINTGANTLGVGSYSDTISFTSSTTGNTTRALALTVNPIVATVSLSNLLQTYTGTAKSVIVTTNPTPIAYSVTYDGLTTAPTNGGTYAVVATVTEPNHTGSASGNLVIAYNVTYLGNGNTGGAVPADQTKFHNVDLTLAANSGNLNKTDYSFAGWNTAFDGSGTPYAGGAAYSGNASLTLYAQWVPGADGTWIQTIAGPFNWGDSANWSAGTVAAGADRTANFTPNITAAQVVNLESARTIGNITFTDSTTASNDLTISGANTLTLTRTSGVPTINVTNRALTISSVIAGNNGILKTGAGTLTLSSVSANTFTGGVEINGGTIATSADGNFGGTGGITVSGTSIWSTGPSVTTYNRSLTINAGTLTLTSGNAGKTITGILSGSGSLINNSTTGFDFNNTGNTFTGAVNNGYQMSFASLGDSSNPINLIGSNSNFIWAGGAKTFALRPFTLNATGTGKFNNNGSGAVVIQQNLTISGTAGARTLSLGGSYTAGANRFSGNIADGTGSVVGLTVTGNATWALSGTNTYTGATSIGNGSPNSTLVIQGLQALSPSTTITMTQTSTPASALRLLDDGTGVLTKPNTLITAFNNAVMNGIIFVGNNSVANGGTSAGTTTGSTIALGTLRLGNNIPAQGFREIQGANGYKLQFNNVELSAGGALTTYSPIFNPTSAAVILGGTIQQLAGNTATTTAVTLNLSGTNSGNSVTGIIKDAVDFGTNVNARSLNVTKTSTSTWTLSGANTYTGTTTVSAGSLIINGDQSSATGDLSVASGATLGGTGTIGGNATIATGGKLEFNISTAPGSHLPLDLVTGKGLTFSGTSTLTITSLAGASPGIYTLITGGNNIVGSAPATVNLPAGWVATVSISGNSLLLNVTTTGGATAGSLAVTAAGGLSSSGFVGGPFSPNSVVYTLSNPGQTDINWTAGKTAAWTALSAASGTLLAGTNTTFTVSINDASANSLGAGSYNDTVTFTNTTNSTGNTTRSVSLTVNALPTYTVSYDGNLNTGGSAPTSQTKTQDVGLTLSGQGTLVRAGYTFTGWNTAANGSGDGYAAGATYNTNASTTLYAQWTPSLYTVTFNANGGDAPNPATTLVTYLSTYGPLATVTRSGYTFTGWFTAASGGSQVIETTPVSITAAQTLYAQWTVNSYTITFDSAGGSAVAPITQNFGTSVTPPAAPTRANYTFASWSPAVPATMPANNLTVTAQWTANTYIVTFDPNGGDVPSPTSKSVTYASTYGPLATVTRSGYSFNGWFTLPSGGAQVTDVTTVAITGAQTLHAQWTLNTYEVTYNANSASSGTVPANQTKTHGVSLTLASNTGGLARTGYTFAGWNTAADGTGTSYAESASYTANAAATLYAKWTANTYTVTFNANGGQTPVPASKVVTFGAAYGTLSATSRTGYLFNGWFTAITGGSQVASDTPVTATDNHTLYARWTQIFPEMDVTRLAVIDVGTYDQVSATTANVDTKLTYGISNSGSDTLTLANAVISATNNCAATVDNQPALSLVPLGSSNLIINLRPGAAGAWSFRVSIGNNDPDENPYQWTVHGVAQSSTTVSLEPVADTYIDDQATTTNYGGVGTIGLSNRTNNPSKSVLRGLMRFTLPAIPATANLSATLSFVQDNANSGLVNFYEATGSWIESGTNSATWANSSTLYGATSFGSVTTSASAGAVSAISLNAAGITKLRDWVAAPATNYGFGITTTYNTKNNSLALRTREATAGNRPTLTLTYTENPQVAEMEVARAAAVVADAGTDDVSGTVAGTGDQVIYTIANLGNIDLTLTTPVLVSAESNCAVVINTQPVNTVMPSAETGLVLTVTPTAAGNWSANLSIANNDSNEAPYNWTIRGTATAAYTITFNSAGGSAVTSITQNFGTTVTAPAAPTRTGYTFAGWSPIVPATMPANDLTVTAQWTLNTYNLNYAAGAGGTLTGQTSQTINHGANGSQVTAVPNAGYNFVKWSDDVMTASRTDTNITAGLSVTANFALITYTSWATGTFTNGALGNQNMTFDFDGDGLATGVEWVIGADPTLTSDATDKKPVFDNTTDPDYFLYSFRRTDVANADPKTSIAVEYGNDLSGWTTVVDDGTNLIITPSNDFHGTGVDKVEVKIKRTLAPSGKLFTRLKVVVTP